jgi:hypothetical protein
MLRYEQPSNGTQPPTSTRSWGALDGFLLVGQCPAQIGPESCRLGDWHGDPDASVAIDDLRLVHAAERQGDSSGGAVRAVHLARAGTRRYRSGAHWQERMLLVAFGLAYSLGTVRSASLHAIALATPHA